MKQDLEQTLKLTTDQIEHKFVKGAIMKLGDSSDLHNWSYSYGVLAS